MMNHPLFQRKDVSIANAYFNVRTVSLLKKEVPLEEKKNKTKKPKVIVS